MAKTEPVRPGSGVRALRAVALALVVVAALVGCDPAPAEPNGTITFHNDSSEPVVVFSASADDPDSWQEVLANPLTIQPVAPGASTTRGRPVTEEDGQFCSPNSPAYVVVAASGSQELDQTSRTYDASDFVVKQQISVPDCSAEPDLEFSITD